jgi:hypothetical protein
MLGTSSVLFLPVQNQSNQTRVTWWARKKRRCPRDQRETKRERYAFINVKYSCTCMSISRCVTPFWLCARLITYLVTTSVFFFSLPRLGCWTKTPFVFMRADTCRRVITRAIATASALAVAPVGSWLWPLRPQELALETARRLPQPANAIQTLARYFLPAIRNILYTCNKFRKKIILQCCCLLSCKTLQ